MTRLRPRVRTASAGGSFSAQALPTGPNPEPGSRAPPPAMSGSLRPGSSSWRRAATLMLAAAWARPSPAAASPPTEGFRVLLLQRSSRQGFMPGAHVFPGGVLDAADRSAEWLRLFAPNHGPQRFGLGPSPPSRAAFPVLRDAADGDPTALPDDVAFRICALRETFEEAGVLLLRPRDSPPAAPAQGRPLEKTPSLEAWRARVRSDPRQFLHLCADLDCTPDIWALHDWSAWVTPFTRLGLRRFDTTFYLCCLQQAPPVYPDAAEVVGCQWLSPSKAIESFISKEIWLAPPQFYEIRRLENFASLSDLHEFCLNRALEGVQRFLPITLLTADGMVQLLPGDELYLEDSKFLEELISTEKKNEEIMKAGKKFHRLVIYNRHLYGIYVTVQSKYKHVYPKDFIVNKSQL